MWVYEKKLEYPVNIKTANPKTALIILSQYGGADTKKLQQQSKGKKKIPPALVS